MPHSDSLLEEWVAGLAHSASGENLWLFFLVSSNIPCFYWCEEHSCPSQLSTFVVWAPETYSEIC